MKPIKTDCSGRGAAKKFSDPAKASLINCRTLAARSEIRAEISVIEAIKRLDSE